MQPKSIRFYVSLIYYANLANDTVTCRVPISGALIMLYASLSLGRRDLHSTAAVRRFLFFSCKATDASDTVELCKLHRVSGEGGAQFPGRFLSFMPNVNSTLIIGILLCFLWEKLLKRRIV